MKTFKIIAREMTTKDGTRKFTAYKAVKKDGKTINLKFTRECENVPDHNCLITIDEANANIDKSREYPCLWVKKIEKIEELLDSNEITKRDLEELFC